MSVASIHNGDFIVIVEWMENHPDLTMTSTQIAGNFDINTKKAANALNWGVKKNRLVMDEKDSHGHRQYRVRHPDEKREEFKIAEMAVVAKPISAPKFEFPVLVECEPEFVTPQLRHYLPKGANDRIQFLNPNTAIVWNSRTQLEEMRQKALS